MITDPSRLILSTEEIAALPVKSVSKSELNELETHMDYNPVCLYSDIVQTFDREVGHDSRFRFFR